jgi:heterodisulfide reductase subunit D
MTSDDKESEQIARCAMCADMCKYSCPTYLATGRETLSPQKMARLIVYDEKGLLEDKEGFLRLMFQSAMCGACTGHCIYGDYDLRKFIHRGRTQAFASGVIPEDVRKRVETYRQFGNPDGERDVIDKGTGDTGYFISCSTFKDEALMRATDKVVSSSGQELRQFGGGDICCGAPLYYAGDLAGFKQASLRMKSAIETRRVKRLVIDCPTCLKMMTEMYRDIGTDLPVELMHTGQYLNALIEQGRLSFRDESRNVTLHDPCILSYDLALAHVPREIIKAMCLNLRETVYSGNHTRCCGGAYGAKIGDRRLKDAVTDMRMKELLATGADVFVTACPTCKSVLSEMNMKYITELVADMIDAER